MICTSGKGMELYRDKLMPAVDEGLAKAEREGAGYDRTIEIKLSFDLDHDSALENTRFWAPLSLSADEKNRYDDPSEWERPAELPHIEKIGSRWIVPSDPDEVIVQVRPYLDLGL